MTEGRERESPSTDQYKRSIITGSKSVKARITSNFMLFMKKDVYVQMGFKAMTPLASLRCYTIHDKFC